MVSVGVKALLKMKRYQSHRRAPSRLPASCAMTPRRQQGLDLLENLLDDPTSSDDDNNAASKIIKISSELEESENEE